jgi:hypothetical protein
MSGNAHGSELKACAGGEVGSDDEEVDGPWPGRTPKSRSSRRPCVCVCMSVCIYMCVYERVCVRVRCGTCVCMRACGERDNVSGACVYATIAAPCMYTLHIFTWTRLDIHTRDLSVRLRCLCLQAQRGATHTVAFLIRVDTHTSSSPYPSPRRGACRSCSQLHRDMIISILIAVAHERAHRHTRTHAHTHTHTHTHAHTHTPMALGGVEAGGQVGLRMSLY